MGFEQYHQPAVELSADVRTFARMIAQLAWRGLSGPAGIYEAVAGEPARA
jgi:hypothetical protein